MTDPRTHGHSHAEHVHSGHNHADHTHADQASEFDWSWGRRLDDLELQAEVGRPWVREAARWIRSLLEPETVTAVLDVGAGPGVFTTELAHEFAGAAVIAIDGDDALLERARAVAVDNDVADRVTTRRMDLADDLSDLPTADLIWVSRVLHHLPDQPRALEQLAARLSPGGVLAVGEGGLPLRFLPDDHPVVPGARPGWFARVESAVTQSIARVLPAEQPPVSDWPGALHAAGLEDVTTRTFLLDLPAPLDPRVRRYAHQHLTKLGGEARDDLEAEDRAALDRLIDEQDPAGASRRPDLFVLAAFSVHVGRAPHR